MYRYTLSGKIHPERTGISLSPEINFFVNHADFGIEGEITIKIEDCNLSIVFESKNPYSLADISGLETLRNILEDTVRIVIDSICYINSVALDIELVNIKCEEPKLNYVFSIKGEWNVNKNTAESDKEFTEVYNLFTNPKNTFLKDVLADFRRAIKYPGMTASFCYRAIETIRGNMFNKGEIKKSWEELRNQLGIKEAEFKQILDFAKLNRHGEYPAISYKEREEIMNFTRKIIDLTMKKLRSLPIKT